MGWTLCCGAIRAAFACTGHRRGLIGPLFATALSLGASFAPTPALAVDCLSGSVPGGQIAKSTPPGVEITCINTTNRSAAGNVIDLQTNVVGGFINLFNTGALAAGGAGIFTNTTALLSPITITNFGPIAAGGTGIWASTLFGNVDLQNFAPIATAGPATFGINVVTGTGGIMLRNSGDIASVALGTFGISALTATGDLYLNNGGNIAVAGGGAFGISAATGLGDLTLINSGNIAAAAGGAFGISAATGTGDIMLRNTGNIAVAAAGTFGISAVAGLGDIFLDNDGNIAAAGAGVFGISAITNGGGSSLELHNQGKVSSGGTGIFAEAMGDNSTLAFTGKGDVSSNGIGIEAITDGAASPIAFGNSGNVATTDANAIGIDLVTEGAGSDIGSLLAPATNSGKINTIGNDAVGIQAQTQDGAFTFNNSGNIATLGTFASGIAVNTGLGAGAVGGAISLINSGNIATADVFSFGIAVVTQGSDPSPLTLVNSGAITTLADHSGGIDASTDGDDGALKVTNSGGINTAGPTAPGIVASTFGLNNAAVMLENHGGIGTLGSNSGGLNAQSRGDNSAVTVINTAAVTTSGALSPGIVGFTQGSGSNVSVTNSGAVQARAAEGIEALAMNSGSSVVIDNQGSVLGGTQGILTNSGLGTTITNSGSISAGSLFAIGVDAGSAQIFNSGIITGYVVLDAADTMTNQSGGTFEARLTSDFGADDDLFVNEDGATVHALSNTSFVNLETFQNQGLISMLNGQVGDVFRISDLVGGTGLAFAASGSSKLGVDAALGPPGSTADNFIVDGTVTGTTDLVVNNTTPGAGAPNKQGIPVVYVNTPVASNAFQLKQPVRSGFYDYDLFFKPGPVNVFELRSAVGGGAFVVPQLPTGAQDIWYTTASSWFDRTADLRTALYGQGRGANQQPAPAYLAGDDNSANAGAATPYPGLWARGSFAGLNRQDRVSFTGFGPTSVTLNRDQSVGDFEGGFDLGTRGLLAPRDALIFGVLGGFVASTVNYDRLEEKFEFKGGEVGAYATYLNGGLFIDALVKDDILTLDSDLSSGLPASLNVNNIGFRIDSGYRFGGFGPGIFFEPLATISGVDSTFDDFVKDGNSVKFGNNTSLRGRLGLRVGSHFTLADGIAVEPFVIGSAWHEFEDNNQAVLVAAGAATATFNLLDDLQGTWAELSAGVNVFNLGAGASGFAKADVAIGNDIGGVGGQVGMRVRW